MKNKRTTIRKTAFFILFLLFSLALGYFLGKLGAQAATDISKGAVIALALLFIPIFFIVIGVHEAGHALAGNLVKFDFRMYVVGPFMWQKEQSIWKFSWNKNVNIAGGMVVCVPTTTENLVRRFSVYAAGGPLASVVLAVLSYGIYRLISGGNVTGHIGLEIIVYFFMIMAMLSLIIFIVTAVPLHTGGFSSDGARVLRLLRGGDTARFETLILKFIASSSGGVRPKMING